MPCAGFSVCNATDARAAQPFFIGQVLIPRIAYSGQDDINPVESGMMLTHGPISRHLAPMVVNPLAKLTPMSARGEVRAPASG